MIIMKTSLLIRGVFSFPVHIEFILKKYNKGDKSWTVCWKEGLALIKKGILTKSEETNPKTQTQSLLGRKTVTDIILQLQQLGVQAECCRRPQHR